MKRTARVLMMCVLTIALLTAITIGIPYAEWRPGQPLPPRKPDIKEPAPATPQERAEEQLRAKIESFYAEPTINYGSEVTLRWRFRTFTDDISALTTMIQGVHMSEINIPIGPDRWRTVSRRTSPAGHNILEGSYTFRPKWKGGYSDFRLTIRHGGKTYQKETSGRGVHVNCYKLEVKSEVIQSPTPVVRFYIENKPWLYSGPYSGRMRIEYAIYLGGDKKSGTLDIGNTNIPTGSRSPDFEVRLSRQEAFSSDFLRVSGKLIWASPYPGEGEQSITSESTHRWAESPGKLDQMILFGVNAYLSTLKFHLHNDGGQASHVYLPSFRFNIRGTSFNIPEIRKAFDIPEMRRRLAGLFDETWGWYRAWVKDINNARIGLDTISISDGGITLNIPVEAEGPTEIRCVYDPLGIGGYTDDRACPDIDLRGPINLKITLIPAVIDGQIGYSSANVDLSIGDTTFPGAWDWFIELFTGDLKLKIESESERKIKELLESREVKDNIQAMIWGRLLEMMSITRITRVEIRGNELLFWYL